MKNVAVGFRPVLFLLVALTLGSCSHNYDLQRASGQEDFGVRMARMNLWREALFRFQRAAELSPQDAEAYNNLAVAYEANGDFDNAAKAYREAMRLDKSNQYIQKNYSRLVEFTSRNKKRQQRPASPTTTPAVGSPAAPASAGSTPVATPAQAPGDAPATPPPPAQSDTPPPTVPPATTPPSPPTSTATPPGGAR